MLESRISFFHRALSYLSVKLRSKYKCGPDWQQPVQKNVINRLHRALGLGFRACDLQTEFGFGDGSSFSRKMDRALYPNPLMLVEKVASPICLLQIFYLVNKSRILEAKGVGRNHLSGFHKASKNEGDSFLGGSTNTFSCVVFLQQIDMNFTPNQER